MPSFDVVSEVDLQEVRNAADQANREVGTRYDFKGSEASFSLDDGIINLQAQSEFQLEQMMDILRQKLAKRSIDVGLQGRTPGWLERNEEPPRGKVIGMPTREDVSLPVNENLVVEYASR